MLDHLTRLSDRYMQLNPPPDAGLPGILFMRQATVTRFEATIYEPVICLILRGSKETCIGPHRIRLSPGDALLISHDLPVRARITRASLAEPYLALILRIDLGLIRALYDQVADAVQGTACARSFATGPLDPHWAEPLARYLALVHAPLDARVLGPSLRREIHYRLLISPLGGMLRNLLSAQSHASRVSRAIHRLRSDLTAPPAIPALAREVGMSASSFHQHFRQVTGTTPLQYLKELRLTRARDLLRGGAHTVATAGLAVGYESPTHFSRDYSRKFGAPPSRELSPAAAR